MIRISRWASVVLLAAASSSTCAQSEPEDVWQPIIWNLQACVRSNLTTVRTAGIHYTPTAVSVFLQLCEKTLLKDAEKMNPKGIPVRPGRLRRAVEEQWLRLQDEGATKYRDDAIIVH